MRKHAYHIPLKPFVPAIAGAIFMLSSCAVPKGEGVAIYLTEEDIPPTQMSASSHVGIAEAPIISMKDILTYNAQTHEMELTLGAFERVLELDVPVSGRTFVVCID